MPKKIKTANIIVKRVRADMGLSQQAFADRLGIHVSSIKRWELDGGVPGDKLLKVMFTDSDVFDLIRRRFLVRKAL